MSLTEQMRRADEREHRKRLKDRIARPSIVDAIADGMARQDVPNPGSDAAHGLGCICPIIDNHFGDGRPGKDGPQFVIRLDCPVHGKPGRVVTAAEHACMDAIERACETDSTN